MKRKLTLIFFSAALLLGGYSAVAWRLLRGAGAYRLGTAQGSVLAATKPFTTLAALVLLIVSGALGLSLWKRHRAEKSGKSGISAALPVDDAGKISPAGPTVPLEELAPPETEKLAPAGPTAPLEEPAPSETEKLAPVGPTVPLGEPVSPETEKLAPAGPTISANETVPLIPVERVCPNCGAKLRSGQRFCTQCGTPLEGV